MPDPGGPPWSQRGTKGGGQTIAVNQRPELKVINESQTSDLPSGEREEIEVYAPAGSMYEVKQLYLYARPPDGATTGSHRMGADSAGTINAMIGSGAFDQKVRFGHGFWRDASNIERPPDTSSQTQQMLNLQADENQPIMFRYTNKTDVTQSKERTIKAVVEVSSF